ncbi:hypothetical protein ZEAMMB73_Zm00001d014978 [Zea mays]|uniref:USP domain-containing protein n=1 Tax=Zea mays TaxID=4577 RepID=A0A1D6GYJ7_MAIZE|nr:hypothetical protein ZEAMMB73_Zm00001d014978 [Zea mays]AQK67829.1 hypothetical protein ZEAMMB73_Zm00001d014978 [Zea mays]
MPSVVEDCSQTSSTRELEDSSIHHAAASVVLESKTTSVHGSLSITHNNSSKVVDSLPDISFKPSNRPGSTTKNLATSLKKMVRQQTAPKVVRHYLSKLSLFPYELFVKLYSKVELHPFGLHNLGNSCYANAVFSVLCLLDHSQHIFWKGFTQTTVLKMDGASCVNLKNSLWRANCARLPCHRLEYSFE